MAKFIKILKTLVISFLFFGCSLKSGDALKLESNLPTNNETAIPAEQLSYQIVYEKVLKKNCVGCHSVAGGNKGDVNLETYASVFENKADVRSEIFSRSMPPSSRGITLSDFQIKIVTDWIDFGAKEAPDASEPPVVNPPGPTAPPTDTPVVIAPPPAEPPVAELSFKNVFEKVIQMNCTTCHSVAAGNRGKVNLETYANVFDQRVDIKADIEDGSMPKLPRGKALTDAQKKLILDWLAVGAPE